MKRFFSHILALCLIIALLLQPALAQALFQGEITVQDEVEMGKEFDQMLRSQLRIVDDPVIADYVAHMVNNLVEHHPPIPFRVTSTVVAHPAMNAFAIPGGYVYVFTGLILNVENEAQLAAVVAHELAHVSQRHVAKRAEKMEGISLLSLAGTLAGLFLGVSGGGSNSRNISSALVVGSQAMATSAYLSYTREMEREADHIGMSTLTGAGYNPAAMPRTFELMLKRQWISRGDSIPSYRSTHPALEERIGYLDERILRMPPDFLERTTPYAPFHRVQTLVRCIYSPPTEGLAYYENKEDKTALDMMGMAICLDRTSRVSEAREAFAQAVEMSPNDPLIIREAGVFSFKNGDMDKATLLLQKAALLNPSDAIPVFYLGRVLGERGNHQAAASMMQRASEMAPEDAEIRYHLGRQLGEAGDLFGAHLNLAYHAYYTGDTAQARFHYGRARGQVATQAQKDKLEKLKETLGGIVAEE